MAPVSADRRPNVVTNNAQKLQGDMQQAAAASNAGGVLTDKWNVKPKTIFN